MKAQDSRGPNASLEAVLNPRFHPRSHFKKPLAQAFWDFLKAGLQQNDKQNWVLGKSVCSSIVLPVLSLAGFGGGGGWWWVRGLEGRGGGGVVTTPPQEWFGTEMSELSVLLKISWGNHSVVFQSGGAHRRFREDEWFQNQLGLRIQTKAAACASGHVTYFTQKTIAAYKTYIFLSHFHLCCDFRMVDSIRPSTTVAKTMMNLVLQWVTDLDLFWDPWFSQGQTTKGEVLERNKVAGPLFSCRYLEGCLRHGASSALLWSYQLGLGSQQW